KNNNILYNTIEISDQNISIIDKNRVKITSSIDSITQQTNDIIPQPIEPITEELNIQENPNENLITDQQNVNQQKNKYHIKQIKNDLEHETEDRVQLNSPYQGSNYIQILNQIMIKIHAFGKKSLNESKD
ncbi:31005_t:CDS:2, partial [Racocetra persica]